MRTEATTSVVNTTRLGGVLLVTIDHPPVNALSVDVRRGLLAAAQDADADAGVAAVLIVGEGRAFIAGADIREFGKPPMAPSLPEVCNRIEACSKPVVVAIHGPALGGGLEVALSAHYRLAMPDARLGLPEVLLGLLPGAGGTQRAPRLMGVKPALEMMLSGRHLGAREALALGLIDRLGEGADVVTAAWPMRTSLSPAAPACAAPVPRTRPWPTRPTARRRWMR